MKTNSCRDAVLTFVTNSDKVLLFGTLQGEDLLKMTDEMEFPLVKAIIQNSIKPLSQVVNLQETIYYAIEKDSTAYLFMEIKNYDSLRALLENKGLRIHQTNLFSSLQNSPIHFAFNNYMAVILIKKKAGNTHDTFEELFKKTRKKSKQKTVIHDIVDSKKENLSIVHLSNLFKHNKHFFEAENPTTLQEIEELMDSCFIATKIHFEEGKIVLETTNYFSDKLQEQLFFEQDTKAKVLHFLGTGQPILGFSMHIEPKKTEEFIAHYLPQTSKIWTKKAQKLSETTVYYPSLLQFLDGQIALIAFDTQLQNKSLFIGLSPRGKKMSSFLGNMLSQQFQQLEFLPQGVVALPAQKPQNTELILPQQESEFGRQTLHFFIDLSVSNTLPIQNETVLKYSDLVEFISASYGQKGGKITVYMKNKQDNILKQFVLKYME